MILPFSTQINGKPTYFVEKIWEGLLRHIFEEDKEYIQYLRLHKVKFGQYWEWVPDETKRMENPKIHTIREDKNNRWEKGKLIHFFINNQRPEMFQFAPVLPVVSTQSIFITRRGLCLEISIDDRYIYNRDELKALAMNDGFDSYTEFRDYFLDAINNNEKKDATKPWFSGKIIHWTDKRY